MPPDFAPTHAWVCPVWRWSHWRLTSPAGSIFESPHSTTQASTTVLYVANSRSTPISLYVDCYTSDGVLEAGVKVFGDVGARQRRQASLHPTRAPQLQPNGDFMDGGQGWFQLWANGPVTPAAVSAGIIGSATELVVPLEPVEIETAVADAPPYVTAEAAPEGGGGAADEALEANLSLPEAIAWFESVRSGRRFDRRAT